MTEDTDWFVKLIKKHKDEILAILAEEEKKDD
jgi:hypothetical protein